MSTPLRLVQPGETRPQAAVSADTPVSEITAGQLVRLISDAVAAVLATPAQAVPVPLAEQARAWLTVDDVAARTGWSAETVQDRARRGLIPMFKSGRDWQMTPAAFDAWERRVVSDGTPREAAYPRRRTA